MSRYHLSPQDGQPRRCSAKIKCEFADMNDGKGVAHYNNKAEAMVAYAENMKREHDTFTEMRRTTENPNTSIDYGFRTYDLNHVIGLDEIIPHSIALVESINETSVLTDVERGTLKTYTSHLYYDLKRALYGEPVHEVPNLIDEYVSKDDRLGIYNTIHSGNVEEIVDIIDGALEKCPGERRVVYSGYGLNGQPFRDVESRDKWLFSANGAISFEGYQSCSADIGSAYDFLSNNNGVLYEISTPEGLNITAVSQATKEKEVLLPRQQSYKIVGSHYLDTLSKGTGSTKNNVLVVQLVAVNNAGEELDGTNRDKLLPLSL